VPVSVEGVGVLVRHGLVAAVAPKRRREDYRRWETPRGDAVVAARRHGSVFLESGRELKLISGVDDRSRFCVIVKVVTRATGRAVCQAFVEAREAYGVPHEVLTDIHSECRLDRAGVVQLAA
jgi:hypothetical protein